MPDSAASPPGTDGTRVTLEELIALRRHAPERHHPPRFLQASGRAGPLLSSVRGRGMAFEEVRIYQPGDDIRNLDWKVTARLGRPHTKLFREERERPVFFLVDDNPSMAFGSRGCYKSVAAARAVAILAWEAVQRQDRVGGIFLTPAGIRECRPAAGTRGVLPLLSTLCRWQPTPRQLAAVPPLPPTAALEQLRRVIRPGSLIQIVSDFRAWDEISLNWAAALGRHCDVVMLFVYDALEADLPVGGRLAISNGRDSWPLPVGNPAWRRAFRERFQQRVAMVSTTCRRHGVGFLLLPTHGDVRESLHHRQSGVPQP